MESERCLLLRTQKFLLHWASPKRSELHPIQKTYLSKSFLYRCVIDLRQPYGVFVHNFYGVSMVTVFTMNGICYGAVTLHIHKIRRMSAKIGSKAHYNRTTAMLAAIVAAYLFQWFPSVIDSIWILLGTPPPYIYVLQVVVVNLGGVYNAFAYTVIRRILLQPSGSGPGDSVSTQPGRGQSSTVALSRPSGTHSDNCGELPGSNHIWELTANSMLTANMYPLKENKWKHQWGIIICLYCLAAFSIGMNQAISGMGKVLFSASAYMWQNFYNQIIIDQYS